MGILEQSVASLVSSNIGGVSVIYPKNNKKKKKKKKICYSFASIIIISRGGGISGNNNNFFNCLQNDYLKMKIKYIPIIQV